VTQYLKDPDAVLDYVFDWSPWLADSETITAHTLTVDDDLTLDSHSVDGTSVTAWLAGGTARTASYKVACRITTSAGRTDERTMSIRVTNR
jgi:hypothetical protein